MRHGLVMLVVSGLALGSLVGCQAPLRSAFEAGSTGTIAAAPIDSSTEMVPAKAEVPRVTRMELTQDVAGAPPVTPQRTYVAAAPCPPTCWSGCGLPCAQGFSDWHARGVVGYAFQGGTETGSSQVYWGVDLGRTFACCWGIDAFYRNIPCMKFDRRFTVVGAAPGLGEDACNFNFVGIKATYQRAFGSSRLYWYAGAGPQFFWTGDAVDNDSGIGGFGELGLGYVISKNWRIRAAVEVLGQSTSAVRLNPIDDDNSRALWFISPVVQVELAL